MKTCTVCSHRKEKADFPKQGGQCFVCHRATRKLWRANNKDKVKISNDKARSNYPEKLIEANRKWRLNHKEKVKADCRTRYLKNQESNKINAIERYRNSDKERVRAIRKAYKKLKSGKINSLNAKRRQLIKRATPIWLTECDFRRIETLYEKAKWLESITGIPYDVDHVIPLQGEEVCGLHIWENLQLLESSLNRRKSNKF